MKIVVQKVFQGKNPDKLNNFTAQTWKLFSMLFLPFSSSQRTRRVGWHRQTIESVYKIFCSNGRAKKQILQRKVQNSKKFAADVILKLFPKHIASIHSLSMSTFNHCPREENWPFEQNKKLLNCFYALLSRERVSFNAPFCYIWQEAEVILSSKRSL